MPVFSEERGVSRSQRLKARRVCIWGLVSAGLLVRLVGLVWLVRRTVWLCIVGLLLLLLVEGYLRNSLGWVLGSSSGVETDNLVRSELCLIAMCHVKLSAREGEPPGVGRVDTSRRHPDPVIPEPQGNFQGVLAQLRFL